MKPFARPGGDGRKRLSAFRIVCIAVLMAATVKVFVLDLAVVDGVSMEPTLSSSAVVVRLRCAYGLRNPLGRGYLARWAEPAVGDVVTVLPRESTALAPSGPRIPVVKRVLEVGPAYLVSRDGMLQVRGGYVEMPAEGGLAVRGSFFLEGGSVFLVGDNAPLSFDSRYYGSVPIEDIDGKVIFLPGPTVPAGSGTARSRQSGPAE